MPELFILDLINVFNTKKIQTNASGVQKIFLAPKFHAMLDRGSHVASARAAR